MNFDLITVIAHTRRISAQWTIEGTETVLRRRPETYEIYFDTMSPWEQFSYLNENPDSVETKT